MKKDTNTALVPAAEAPAEYKRIDSIRTEIQVSSEQKYATLSMFTDLMPWDKKRYIKAAKEDFNDAVLKSVSLGRRLLVLKEMLPHGEFLPALEEIGISEQTARNYMRVALRFVNMDDDTKNALGVGKLYALLKAPQDEIDRLENAGTIFDLQKEDVVKMSSRQLALYIKESNAKSKLDLDQERLKSDLLFREKQQLQKDKDALEKEIFTVKNGAPPAMPLPKWWNEYEAAVGAVMMLATALAGNAPDLQNQDIVNRCEQCWTRLHAEIGHVRKYLQLLPLDPVETSTAIREKVAKLNNDSRFDFSLLKDSE